MRISVPPSFNSIVSVESKNLSLTVKSKVNCEIEIKESNDPRSYRLDSSKLLKTGFYPNSNVEDAVDEIIVAYKEGTLIDREQWHTVKWMKSQNFG